MALSAYSAYGQKTSKGSAKLVIKASGRLAEPGQMIVQNAVNRMTGRIRKFTFIVKIKGVASDGHTVWFFSKDGMRKLGGSVSAGGGYVTFYTDYPGNITAVVEDKAGGDYYNALIRSDLVPVAVPVL